MTVQSSQKLPLELARMMMMVMKMMDDFSAYSTGGLRGAEADLALQQRKRQTTSQDLDGDVRAGRKSAFVTSPRGLRSGQRDAAPVTS